VRRNTPLLNAEISLSTKFYEYLPRICWTDEMVVADGLVNMHWPITHRSCSGILTYWKIICICDQSLLVIFQFTKLVLSMKCRLKTNMAVTTTRSVYHRNCPAQAKTTAALQNECIATNDDSKSKIRHILAKLALKLRPGLLLNPTKY